MSSNILALSSPTLSLDYRLCPRHQTSDHADTPTWASPPSNPVQSLCPPSSLWTLTPSTETQDLSLDFLLPLPLPDTHRQPGVGWLEVLAKLGFGSGLVKGSTEVPRLEFMAAAAMEMGAAQTEALPCRTPE